MAADRIGLTKKIASVLPKLTRKCAAIALIFGTGVNALGETKADPSAAFLGTLSYGLELRMDPQDLFYQKYFSKLDPGIERAYQDRWKYHDMQLPYALGSWGFEHLSLGSLNTSNFTQPEWRVRQDFAQQVLRMRFQSAVREFLSGVTLPQTIRHAQNTVHAIDSLKNNAVSIGGGGEGRTPVHMRFGYDIVTDSSKLELVRGSTTLGVYHPQLFTSFVGAGAFPTLALASVRLNTVLDDAKTKTLGMGYRWGDSTVEASFVNNFTPAVTGRLAGSQSIRPINPYSSLYAELAMRFDL